MCVLSIGVTWWANSRPIRQRRDDVSSVFILSIIICWCCTSISYFWCDVSASAADILYLSPLLATHHLTNSLCFTVYIIVIIINSWCCTSISYCWCGVSASAADILYLSPLLGTHHLTNSLCFTVYIIDIVIISWCCTPVPLVTAGVMYQLQQLTPCTSVHC